VNPDGTYVDGYFGFPATRPISEDNPVGLMRSAPPPVVRRPGTTNLIAMTRVCSTCREEKPLTAFHRNRDDPKAGRMHRCKACRRLYGGSRTRVR